jgi:MFS family permease
MLPEILRLLRRHPWFLVLSLAYIVSGAGSGLTDTVVYGNLADLHATPMWFAAMYAVTMAMGVVMLQFGKKILAHLHVLTVLLLAEALGLSGLAMPCMALHLHSQILFVLGDALSMLYVGLAYPAFSVLIRNGFTQSEMPAATAVDTLTFSAIVILGRGVGAFLYPYVASTTLLLADAASYLIGAVLILSAVRANRLLFAKLHPDVPRDDPAIKGLRGARRRAFFLPVLLSLVTAPALALLPSIGVSFSGLTVGRVLLAPTLLALFARNMGQITGSLALRGDTLAGVFQSPRILLALIASFFASYIVAMSSRSFMLVLAVIAIAHMCSSMVVTVAYTARLRRFSAEETASVSVRGAQLMLLVQSTMALCAGWLAERLSLRDAFLALALPALAVVAAWLVASQDSDDEV